MSQNPVVLLVVAFVLFVAGWSLLAFIVNGSGLASAF